MIIDNTTYKAKSFDERIKFLVLHYTERNLETSLELLSRGNVSAHYLISDTKPNHILQLVDESKRAWHAGESSWQGRQNLNDTSIGIEIVNLGYKNNSDGSTDWHPYSEEQIKSVIELCQNIIKNYNIHPTCVVAHSDIAPNRKQDPGPLFPWKTLYDNGIGAWYDGIANRIKSSVDLSNIKAIQENFNKYGYDILPTAVVDQQTINVIKSFQMHFRPKDYSGELDIETVAILEALLQKYNIYS